MPHYNEEKHKELIAERGRVSVGLNELGVKMNETWEGKSDAQWSAQDLANYKANETHHSQIATTLGVLDREIANMEALLPQVALDPEAPHLRQDRALRQFLRHTQEGTSANEKSDRLYADMMNEDGQLVLKSPYAQQFSFPDNSKENPLDPTQVSRVDPRMAGFSDIDSGTGSRGGMKKAAPQTWSDDPVFQLVFSGDIQRFATSFMTANGNEYHMVNIGGAADKGEIYATQAAAITSQDIPDLSVVTFKAWDSSSKKIGVHRSAVYDVPVIRGGMLLEMMGVERVARAWNDQYFNGTTASTSQKIVGNVLEHTTTASTAVAYEDLLGLEYSIDRAYRTGSEMIGPGGFRDPERGRVGWILHDKMEQSLRSLKASSRPLWTPGITAGSYGMVDGAPSRLLGYEYGVSNDITIPSGGPLIAGAVPMLFGNWAYYGIRTVEELTVERFYDSNSVPNFIYIVWARRDARFIGAINASSKCEALAQLKIKT